MIEWQPASVNFSPFNSISLIQSHHSLYRIIWEKAITFLIISLSSSLSLFFGRITLSVIISMPVTDSGIVYIYHIQCDGCTDFRFRSIWLHAHWWYEYEFCMWLSAYNCISFTHTHTNAEKIDRNVDLCSLRILFSELSFLFQYFTIVLFISCILCVVCHDWY